MPFDGVPGLYRERLADSDDGPAPCRIWTRADFARLYDGKPPDRWPTDFTNWRSDWSSLADLLEKSPRQWVPGLWAYRPPIPASAFIEQYAEDGWYSGVGLEVRRLDKTYHGADTIRLAFGPPKHTKAPRGKTKTIFPPNTVAVGLARANATTFPITVVHNEETFDFHVDQVGGNDSNDGTTPATAWKTTSKLTGESSSFTAGTRVGCKRGSVFTSGFTPNTSGASGNRIVYGAYGTGVVPIFDNGGGSGTIMLVSNKSFLRFENLRWQNTSAGATVDFSNCPNGECITCDFLNNTSSNGMRLRDGSDSFVIDGGQSSDNGNSASGSGARGHGYALLAADNCTIRNVTANRETEDSVQVGNSGNTTGLTLEDSTLNNNGEDAFDIKNGNHTIQRCNCINDNSATARGGDTNGRKGINQGQSDGGTVTCLDSFVRGWGFNQWQSDSPGKLVARRTVFDDSGRATSICVDAKGPNAGLTLEACLIIVRTSGNFGVRFSANSPSIMRHCTGYQGHGSATTDLIFQGTGGNNLTLVNNLMVHANPGLCLEIDQVSDLNDGDNNVFDNASGDFANVDGTGYNSGEVAAFNSAMSSTGNVYGDPQFANAGGTAINDYLPNAAGAAHQAGKSGTGVTTDINGDPFNGTTPTAGCLQI